MQILKGFYLFSVDASVKYSGGLESFSFVDSEIKECGRVIVKFMREVIEHILKDVVY